MKRQFITAALMISLLVSGIIMGKNNSMKVSPAKPKAGDEITVTFNPAGTGLAKAEKISMTIYSFSTIVDGAVAIDLIKSGKMFTGKFRAGEKTEFIGLTFEEGETKESNDEKGYYIDLYNKDGKKTDGSIAGSALIFGSWGRYFGVKADTKKAYDNFESALKLKPELKQKYVKEYISIITAQLKEKGDETVAALLQGYEQKGNLTEDDYSYVQRMYVRVKKMEKADELKKLIMEKYPHGQFAAYEFYLAFNKEKETGKKIEMLDSFVKNFPGSSYLTTLINNVNNSFIKDKKYKESADFLKKYSDKLDPSFLTFISKQYIKANQEVETAVEFCKTAVEKLKKEIGSSEGKPAYYTEKQWNASKKANLASNLTSLAEAYSAVGKKEDALKCYEEAMPSLTGDNADPQINEKYVKLLAQAKQEDKASKLIEEYISDGTNTAEMKNIIKEIYVKKNGNEAGFDKYLGKFEKIGKERLTAKMKKEMINEPAPQFTLLDLDGKKVSLAGLKGKIVIVDFWATWCGPCISSFPGMQKAQNIWKDKGVEFLFVNTWENAPEASKDDKNWKKNNASDFIKKNNYTFHVLMDEESKVVADFKVSGIPTKFIIDKNGKIRFKLIGSDGIDDKTVAEINTMVELLK